MDQIFKVKGRSRIGALDSEKVKFFCEDIHKQLNTEIEEVFVPKPIYKLLLNICLKNSKKFTRPYINYWTQKSE